MADRLCRAGFVRYTRSVNTAVGSSGSVTLALCQIAGEHALASRVPVALERSREVLARLMARICAEFHGTPVEANLDGALFSFQSVASAVGFALRLQVQLLIQDWPSALLLRPEAAEQKQGDVVLFRGLQVRVGIHSGAICGEDPVASLVPVADHTGRIAAVAHPGQVLLTEVSWRQFTGNPGVPFVLRDHGVHRLSGVLGRQRLIQVQPAALDRRPVLVPDSLDVVRANRPAEARPDVGQGGELAAIVELYGLGVRMITLVAAPGTGGRSLAAQVASAARAEGLPGGVWWCAVASRTGPVGASDDPVAGDLVRALADALGISISQARSDIDAAVQLGWSLAARERLLVVIDGIDATDADSMAVLGRWLRAAPLGRFLCLAPRRLGVEGEVVFQSGPLAVRPAPSDAARFLLQRVPPRSASPFLDLLRVEPLAAAVRGIPQQLAIAGGLLGQLSPEELGARRTDSAQALFTLAWENATDEEHDVLLSGARFNGAFEPWQAAAVVDPDLADPRQVAAVLAELASRSLLEVARSAEVPSRARYVVSDSLRSFLQGVTDLDRMGRVRRWAESSSASAEAWSRAAHGPSSAEALARLVGETPNLLAVVRWGLTESPAESWRVDVAARTLLALQSVFENRGPFVGQVRLLDLAVLALDASLDVDPSVQVRMLCARAEAQALRGKGRISLQDLERGLEIAQRWDDPAGAALCGLGIGVAKAERPEDDPTAELQELADVLAALGAPRRQAQALATSGRVHFALGRGEAAERALRSAVEIARRVGAHGDEGRFLADLARVLWGRGRLRQARSTYREASRLHEETGDRRREAHVGASLGDLDHIEGRLPDALQSYALATRLARETGERGVECHAQTGAGMVALESGDVDGSRTSLLAALAIIRDLEDGRAEGMLVGQLGLVHHFGALPTAANDYYRRAVGLFQGPNDRRERAMWLGWLAALAGEQGEVDSARETLWQATQEVEGLEDRGIGEILALLGAIVDLCIAASFPDRTSAERMVQRVRDRYAAARADRLARTSEFRLALRRLELALAPRDSIGGARG